jgi:hypothetical protein
MNRSAYLLGTLAVAFGSVVAVALRAFAEAAFLGAYGANQMPWLPIANAAGFAVATLGYDALLRRLRERHVDVGLLVTLGVAAAAAPALLANGAPPVVLVVALAAASQVAGLALWNRVAASVAGRDARRMLPRAGAAVTAGGALAGLGAGGLIPRLGLSFVPYAAAAVTVVVLAIALAQERALVRGGAPGGGAVAATGGAPLGGLQRRLLGALIAVAVLEAVVATVIDLQFLAGVKGRYTGEDVAIALALFYGGTNLVLLVVQATAAPILLVTRSLTFTSAIHPVLVIAAYAGFAAAPGFFGIAGTRTADQVLRLATSRTSQEVSLSAFPPAPRARWKVLLRGAVWPVGAAAAGLVLLALGPTAPARLAVAAIAVAAVWAITARIAARRFQTALAAPLGIAARRREDPRRIDLETLRRWTAAAGGENPKQAALARAALARARVDASDLGDHLRDDDPEVRAAMFEQLVREPVPALRGELKAAIAIEDDDRALAFGIKALALVGDDAGIARGKSRAGLAREVDRAVELAGMRFGAREQLARQVPTLIGTDARWAIELVRTGWLDEVAPIGDALRAAADDRDRRAGAMQMIACLAHVDALPMLVAALESGDRDAITAIERLDAAGARLLAGRLATTPERARAAIARASAGAEHGAPLIAALLDDRDPEVAHAALRVGLAIAGDGGIPATRVAAARETALAALIAHLDARDAAATDASHAGAWSACARAELELATRRCVARLTWTAAVEAAASGRDPAPIAAVARRLVGDAELDRRRALDVAQELETRADALAAIERWLKPAGGSGSAEKLAAFDPWLAKLGAGELAALEPTLEILRGPALFKSLPGPALAQLADRAARRRVDGDLFRAGDPGEEMFVVADGALVAHRPPAPERRIEVGQVVGELAVLTHAPRAATVSADGSAEVLAIDRAAFTAAARRAPELVLGLAATLAGWLAPNRPDLL